MTSPPAATTAAANDLIGYIIDIDDEECPDFSLHLAAYQARQPLRMHLADF